MLSLKDHDRKLARYVFLCVLLGLVNSNSCLGRLSSNSAPLTHDKQPPQAYITIACAFHMLTYILCLIVSTVTTHSAR